MNKNMKNSAKRTIASLLAALTVMTSVVPMLPALPAFAEDAPEQETTAETMLVEETTEETPEQKQARQDEIKKAAKENFLKRIDNTSYEALYEAWEKRISDKSTTNTYSSDDLTLEEKQAEDEALEDVIRNMGAEIATKAIMCALKSQAGDNGDIAEPVVGSVVNLLFGAEGDASNKDVMQHIDQTTERLVNEIEKAHASTINSMTDITSAIAMSSYIQEYDNQAGVWERSINDIYTRKANKYPTENDRTAAIAAVLGDLENFRDTASCEQTAYNLMMLPSVIDPNSRGLFDVAYSDACNKSMFKGEAIDRSAPFIMSRVSHYVKNNSILIGMLNAQIAVDRFTDEEVAVLSPKGREAYDKVKENAGDALAFQKEIIGRMADTETGILPYVERYFNQTDRTVFINKTADRTKFTPITLSPEFHYAGSNKYIKEVLDADVFDTTLHDKYIRESGLTTQQISDICKHAASACKTLSDPTRRGYFEAVGFKFDDSQMQTKRNNKSAVFATDYFDSINYRPFGEGWIGLKGFPVNNTSGCVENGFIHGHCYLQVRMRAEGDPFAFIYFVKA
ncbi:MAG: hypothetical protein J5851_10200 [Oscillospiraceae bacterium]|nr:hypothetical protein [Oscillospiraceae bacterium]